MSYPLHLSSHIVATSTEKESGCLEIDGGGAIYFLLGNPIHAVMSTASGILEGPSAVELMASRYTEPIGAQLHHTGPPPGVSLAGWQVEDLIAMLHSTPAASRLPIFPEGRPMIVGVPISSVDVDLLLETLASGMLRVSLGERTGAIFVHSGAIFAAAIELEDETVYDEKAVHAIRNSPDAIISVFRLAPEVCEVVAGSLTGSIVHANLEIEWIVWASLVSAFKKRAGLVVFEVNSDHGKGIGALLDGKPILAYTSKNPVPGNFNLLDKIILGASGTVQVRTSSLPESHNQESSPKKATSHPKNVEVAQPVLENLSPPQEAVAKAPTAAHRPTEESEEVEGDSAPWLSEYDPLKGLFDGEEVETPEVAHANDSPVLTDDLLAELSEEASNELKVHAKPVLALLKKGAEEGWSASQTEQAVRALRIRAIQPERLNSLAKKLADIIEES